VDKCHFRGGILKSPVLKNILAAVLGYVVMFAVSFPLFGLLWSVLGADGAFAAGSWNVSCEWIIGSIVLGGLVSIAGGFSCSWAAVSRGGVAILVGLVLAFGILALVPDAGVAPGLRPDQVSMFDAMTSAQQPLGMLWLNPVLGVIGVLFGAMLQGGKPPLRQIAD